MPIEGALTRRKILIVDDQAAMRTLIRRLCTIEEDEVVECSDGAEAVAAYAQRQPDWVIMDIKMREVDGLKATAQILDSHPQARVVIVTQEPERCFRKAAEQAGAIAFFSKDNLLEIRELLLRGQAGAGA